MAVIVGVLMAVVLVVVIASIVVLYKRTKARNKSRREAEEFNRKHPVRNLPPEFIKAIDDPDAIAVRMKVWNCDSAIPPRNITKLEVIGNGNFGVVYSGWLRDDDLRKESPVAIKELKGIPHSKEGTDTSDASEFLKEALLMKKLDHPNVMSCVGISVGPVTCIVLEVMSMGDLRTYLTTQAERQTTVTVAEKYYFAFQIACGMRYLQNENIVHRDLAARNCMLSHATNSAFEYPVLKVTDFGMSRMLDDDKEYYHMEEKGQVPARWTALEGLLEQKFSWASDVWSYGVALWELFDTDFTLPYLGMNLFQLVEYLKEDKRLLQPNECPLDAYEIMIRCWRRNPDDRPDFEDLTVAVGQLFVPHCKSTYVVRNEDGYTYLEDMRRKTSLGQSNSTLSAASRQSSLFVRQRADSNLLRAPSSKDKPTLTNSVSMPDGDTLSTVRNSLQAQVHRFTRSHNHSVNAGHTTSALHSPHGHHHPLKHAQSHKHILKHNYMLAQKSNSSVNSQSPVWPRSRRGSRGSRSSRGSLDSTDTNTQRRDSAGESPHLSPTDRRGRRVSTRHTRSRTLSQRTAKREGQDIHSHAHSPHRNHHKSHTHINTNHHLTSSTHHLGSTHRRQRSTGSQQETLMGVSSDLNYSMISGLNVPGRVIEFGSGVVSDGGYGHGSMSMDDMTSSAYRPNRTHARSHSSGRQSPVLHSYTPTRTRTQSYLAYPDSDSATQPRVHRCSLSSISCTSSDMCASHMFGPHSPEAVRTSNASVMSDQTYSVIGGGTPKILTPKHSRGRARSLTDSEIADVLCENDNEADSRIDSQGDVSAASTCIDIETAAVDYGVGVAAESGITDNQDALRSDQMYHVLSPRPMRAPRPHSAVQVSDEGSLSNRRNFAPVDVNTRQTGYHPDPVPSPYLRMHAQSPRELGTTLEVHSDTQGYATVPRSTRARRDMSRLSFNPVGGADNDQGSGYESAQHYNVNPSSVYDSASDYHSSNEFQPQSTRSSLTGAGAIAWSPYGSNTTNMHESPNEYMHTPATHPSTMEQAADNPEAPSHVHRHSVNVEYSDPNYNSGYDVRCNPSSSCEFEPTGIAPSSGGIKATHRLSAGASLHDPDSVESLIDSADVTTRDVDTHSQVVENNSTSPIHNELQHLPDRQRFDTESCTTQKVPQTNTTALLNGLRKHSIAASMVTGSNHAQDSRVTQNMATMSATGGGGYDDDEVVYVGVEDPNTQPV